MDIATTLFNNLRPDGREFLISEGVQVPQRLPTETNHQGNQRLILVINAAVEAENNTRTINQQYNQKVEASITGHSFAYLGKVHQ